MSPCAQLWAQWKRLQVTHEREERQRRVAAQKEMFKRALQLGVNIICGSDVGVFAHGENAWEIELMVQYGMSPQAALQAATLKAARLLGIADQIGELAPGKLADIIAVKDDPLADVRNLREVVFVMKEGKIYINKK